MDDKEVKKLQRGPSRAREPQSDAASSTWNYDPQRLKTLVEGIPLSRGFRIEQEVHGLTTSLRIVETNYQELSQFLHFLTEDSRSHHLTTFQMYQSELPLLFTNLTRLLHNYVAAAFSLVDHTRRAHRILYPDSSRFPDYQARVDRDFTKDPLSQFMKGLRNYVVHREVVPMEFKNHMGGFGSASTFKIERRAMLAVAKLLEWDGWDPLAKSFLKSSSDLDVGQTTKAYRDKVIAFHAWFQQRVRMTHANELGELYEMQRELFLIHLGTQVSMLSRQDQRQLAGGGESIFHGILTLSQLVELERMGADNLAARAERAVQMLEQRFTLPHEMKDRIIAVYQTPEFLPRRPLFGIAPEGLIEGDNTLALFWSAGYGGGDGPTASQYIQP